MSHERLDVVRSILLDRTVFALVGVLWGMRSLQAFTDPNFTDPETVADWWAVVSWSLCLALLPAGLALLVRLSQRGGRASYVMLVIAALGAVTAAIANVIEDGMGVDAAGSVYFVSVSLMMLTMIALAGVLLAGRPRWPGVPTKPTRATATVTSTPPPCSWRASRTPSRRVDDLVAQAEKRSATICERGGVDGLVCVSARWYKTLCSDCAWALSAHGRQCYVPVRD